MEAGKRIPLTDIGSGVYPTTIFFNHSCAPNTVRINMGKRVRFEEIYSGFIQSKALLKSRLFMWLKEILHLENK